MTLSYSNILRNTIGVAAGTAAFCAFAGKFVKSPTLHKVQDAATSIAIVGSACYAYLYLGNTPVSAPAPAPVIPVAYPAHTPPKDPAFLNELGRFKDRDQCTVTEGGLSQFDDSSTEAGCTVFAAEGLLSMLKGVPPQAATVNQVICQGGKTYNEICENLKAQGFMDEKDGRLDIQQCLTGFYLMLCTQLNDQDHPQQMAMDRQHVNPFSRAIETLATTADNTQLPQGALVMISNSTYAISISPLVKGKRSIQFFDSHGSHDFDPTDARNTPVKALWVKFPSTQKLADYLQWKKQGSTNFGMHHCWLYQS